MLTATCLVPGCSAEYPENSGRSDGPLNVVLISVDTLRADHVGLYGYERDTTPNVDAFFSKGSIFENTVASSPCTIPTVPQFLAGTGIVNAETPILAEQLRDAGYRTHAIASQQQFRPRPRRKPAMREMAAQVRRGFDHFDLQGEDEVDHHGLSLRTATEVSDRALAWLDESGPEEPFFLWLHYFDPHDPYEPPEPFRGFAADTGSSRGGDRRAYLKAERESPTSRWQRAGHVFSAPDVARIVGLYDGEIQYTDHEIGRVLDELERRGLVEKSLIVFLSDHGEWLGEEDRWDHCQGVHDRELRVPLLVRHRGGPLEGKGRVATRVSTVDLAPTVLALTGVAKRRTKGMDLDGVDLREASVERQIFSTWGRRTSLWTSDWKLVFDGSKRSFSLYDLASGEGEVRDLFSERLEIGKKLRTDLMRFRARHRDLAKQNEEMLEQLRAIGYTE